MITTSIEAVQSPQRFELDDKKIALFAATLVLVSAVLWADKPISREKTDFSVTYIGSRMVYLGLGPKLYDLSEQQKLKSSLLKHAEPIIFEHPPFEAFLLAPLGALPYPIAYLLWGLLNVGVWLYLPHLLRPYICTPRDDLGYLVLWLLFAPLGVTLLQGQSSLLILLFYSLTFINLKQRRDFRAGAIFAMGLLKFQFIVPFALIFVFRRQWKFIRGFLATASGLAIVSVVAIGWRGVWSYITLLTNVAHHPGNSTLGAVVGMATLQGFVYATIGKFISHGVTSLVVASMSGLLVAGIAIYWRNFVQDEREVGFDLMFATSVVVSLVTGFHMFTHDLSPLMLAMLLVCSHFPSRRLAGLRLVLGASLVVFWIPFLYFALLAWKCVYVLVPVLVGFLLATARLGRLSAGSELPTVKQLSARQPNLAVGAYDAGV